MRCSVIIPTYCRPRELARCLAALRALRPPPGGYEIIVVNDGGPPVAGDLLAAGAGAGHRLTVLEQPNAGPAAARNHGARMARGEFLAFTDDDCRPDAAWLVALDGALRANPEALVGGRTILARPADVYAAASHSLVTFCGSYFDGGTAGRFFASNNLAVSRDGYAASGGFNEGCVTAEDRELADRWATAGRPTAVAPDAVVQHAHALSFGRFVRQHVAYGRGARTFRRLRAEAGRPVRVDVAFYARSLAYPFRGGEPRAPAVALLTLVAHGAHAAGLLTAPAAAPAPRPPAFDAVPHPATHDATHLEPHLEPRPAPLAGQPLPDARPALTVAIITLDDFESIRTTVRHIAAQTFGARIELLICAPALATLALDAHATAALHSVRVLETGPITLSGPIRARAAREARAPVIAYAEDHCYPDPDWAAALVAAHAQPHAAVGPAVRNANPESVVSWADLLTGYGPWIAPGRSGQVGLLPGHNSSYKRVALLAFGAELDDLMEAETVLFWALRRRGHTLYMAAAATVAHLNFTRWAVWLPVEWHLGRVFAGQRALRWSLPRRLAFALATPLIPALRAARILLSARRNGLPLPLVARIAPALLIGLVINAAGQGVGCVRGAGGSTVWLTAREFHRIRANRGGRGDPTALGLAQQ